MKKFVLLQAFVVFALLFMPFLKSPQASAATVTCPDGTTVTQVGTIPLSELCVGHMVYTPSCDPKSDILAFPTWYKYLPQKTDQSSGDEIPKCVPQICKSDNSGNCLITRVCDSNNKCTDGQETDLSKIWLIGLAIIELLLRIGALVAVGIVIFGGFKYITSQGSPDATKNARGTIINAFIGIVIILVATVAVNFLARLIG